MLGVEEASIKTSENTLTYLLGRVTVSLTTRECTHIFSERTHELIYGRETETGIEIKADEP